ncbi:MAG: right-handed parallel beta-helix repeat-containing protein [Xanthomonadales bacterium]|nr:right-handed parallel beta-helix repeat-containing protein [Xanthomonadales bacterium]
MFRRFLMSLFASCLLAGPLRADVVCVDTVSELVNALASFEYQVDGTSRTVKVVQGTYLVGNQLGGTFASYPNSVTFSIKGGYTAGCASRVINPANTVIDGNNLADSGFSFSVTGDANFFVEGLSFTRLDGSGWPAFGIGLDVGTSNTARFTIRHCRFTRNAGASIVRMNGPEMRFTNNLVADNLPSGSGRAGVLLEYSYEAGSGAIATNNTIATNSGSGLRLLDFDGQVGVRFSEITNNILWNNVADLDLGEFDPLLNPIFVEGNVVEDYSGIQPLSSSNLTSNPQFINLAAGNYGLNFASPAINSGFMFQSLGFPSKDLAGGERVVGTKIDRGAFESSIDDRVAFVVTNVGDNGSNTSPLAGSLRAAIKAANAAAGPYRITFEIGGACPHIINLTTTMLDITGDVTLDARTQNGWSPNTFYGRSDANLCIVLNGSGATAHAFRVPSLAGSDARLAVFGMMFAGFTDAALRVENGHDHRIAGNQFGAVPFTSPNGAAVRVTGSSGGAFIGGYDDPASMNLIAGSTVAGVYLDNANGGSTIANNVIGYQTDGMSAGGNQIGVFVFNSPNNHLQYNYIGYSAATGITLSGAASQDNEIQYNGIGADWVNGTPGNTGAGIGILFGAHDNTIGAPLLGAYGWNYIARNTGPGVWISASGGAGNRVLYNTFFDNGAIDIDLGAAGPSANQVSNPAVGPNHLQNYPTLTLAERSTGNSPTLSISGQLHSAPNTAYRFELYVGRCDPQAPTRGTAEYWVGRINRLTDAQGDVTFSAVFSVSNVYSHLTRISATATSSSGDTSEIGECFPITDVAPPDALFQNGFE